MRTEQVKTQLRQQKKNVVTNENYLLTYWLQIIANPYVSARDITRNRNISQSLCHAYSGKISSVHSYRKVSVSTPRTLAK